MELSGSSWVHDRFAGISIDLFKSKTGGVNSFNKLPTNYLSILNNQNTKNYHCAFWSSFKAWGTKELVGSTKTYSTSSLIVIEF